MNKLDKHSELKEKTFPYIFAGCAIVLFYFLLANISYISSTFKRLLTILSPFVWGCGFAYLMWLMADWMEKTFLKKLSYKKKRILSSFLSLLAFLLIVSSFFFVIIPQLISSIMQIYTLVSENSGNLLEFVEMLADKFSLSEDFYADLNGFVNDLLANVLTFVKERGPAIFSSAVDSAKGFMNIIIGLVVALYILLDRDHLKGTASNVFRAYLNESQYDYLCHALSLTNNKISNFISGKLWDSLIIGVICFVVMNILGMEYSLLIYFIVGITNIIPFFGPFIGAIPSIFILLIVSPIHALEFMIWILILQQIDGNIIGPKILGGSVGLSSLWIMFAILVGGGYFGVLGMVLGVPLFAAFYFLFRDHIHTKLKEKGLEVNESKDNEIIE